MRMEYANNMDAMVKLEVWRKANDVFTYECVPYSEAEEIIEHRLKHTKDRYAHIQSLEHDNLHLYYFVWKGQIGCDVTMQGAIRVAQNPSEGVLV